VVNELSLKIDDLEELKAFFLNKTIINQILLIFTTLQITMIILLKDY